MTRVRINVDLIVPEKYLKFTGFIHMCHSTLDETMHSNVALLTGNGCTFIGE